MRYFLATVLLILQLTATAAEIFQERSTPRLKFRDGPVCMCMGGLNEADITRADKLRFIDNLSSNAKKKKRSEKTHQEIKEE
ncbi:MAG: hypothetical protein HQL48_02700 [Gammaproteobacteria bacterium]|nr:hypothetical protein [Gammaproteobacteria bacterium]